MVESHYDDEDCPEDLKKSADLLKDNMKGLDDEIRRLFDEQYVAKILDPLQNINRHLEEQTKQMSHREYLKLDYDSYVREVAKLKEKGDSSNHHKLEEKEAQKEKAKQTLDDATQKLYNDFDLVESKRFSVITPQLNKVRLNLDCILWSPFMLLVFIYLPNNRMLLTNFCDAVLGTPETTFWIRS